MDEQLGNGKNRYQASLKTGAFLEETGNSEKGQVSSEKLVSAAG